MLVRSFYTCQSPCLRVSLPREWLGPGGLPGLQNRWRVALRAAVGSTPIHSRLHIKEGRVTLERIDGLLDQHFSQVYP